jgi:putative transposase
MDAVEQVAPELGLSEACRVIGVPRASFYRHRRPPRGRPCIVDRPPKGPRRHRNALTAAERQRIVEVCHQPRFWDASPLEVYFTLLDEGVYLGSWRTFYRVLHERGEVRERRDQLHHLAHPVPRLHASRPNAVWTWDVTKLLGPAKWTYYYLCVVLDLFSRYAVGWTVASADTAAVARWLIDETLAKYGVDPRLLTIHSDRGASQTAKPVAHLLADLGVTKSLSRPRVSNDNPYSESQFKTLKYRPWFPDRFDSKEQAAGFCRTFFGWYNDEHRHSGIGYLTPATVYFGRAEQVHAVRAAALADAYARHPERFVRKMPQPPALPGTTWINRPAETEEVTH